MTEQEIGQELTIQFALQLEDAVSIVERMLDDLEAAGHRPLQLHSNCEACRSADAAREFITAWYEVQQ